MRPKITTCRSVAHSISYNEEKVELHIAERLTAANLLKSLERLTMEDILHRFDRRMELNDRVRTSLHITLNFDPQDKLTGDQMREIARTYMKEIGFERQPWIAWRHNDAGHPHCHIVTTHDQWNGDPIDLYKIGEIRSEKARLKIEAQFNLITAEIKQRQRDCEQRLYDQHGPPRLIYGQQPLARSLSDIVGYVSEKYHFTSLREFNAVLRLYNVEAYAGGPDTKLYQARGLLYRALDQNGRYIGRPLKASFFHCKPTLENLEKKFRQNLSIKYEHKRHVEVNACYHLAGKPDNLEKVRQNLQRDGIALVLRKDKSGAVSEVAFVDTRNKVVITGDDPIWACEARAIHQVLERQQVRLAREQTLTQTQRETLRRGPRLRM